MPLVISRRPGESIDINGPSRVTLARSTNGRAKFLIEAAPEVGIVRTEIATTERDKEGGDGPPEQA